MNRLPALSKAALPTRFGLFTVYGFAGESAGDEYVVLTCGELPGPPPAPLLRIHSQCLTGDVFGSLRCDCGQQLEQALLMIQRHGKGLLIYQPKEGRGIGILNKLKAYELQDQGQDTVEANLSLGFEADLRDYADCAGILTAFGIQEVAILSNNPSKIAALEKHGITVSARVPLETAPSAQTRSYLQTKKEKMGHLLREV